MTTITGHVAVKTCRIRRDQRNLIQLARHLNDQPRKCLNYRTPAEVFRAHLQEGG